MPQQTSFPAHQPLNKISHSVRRSKNKTRLAYSTDTAVCRQCGAAIGRCSCLADSDQPVPEKIVAKLRIEKSGRGGKTVTVVYDLPRNRSFLNDLSKQLKSACGSGGKAGRDTVEVQGDHRDRLRSLLSAKGWTVKG